MTSLGDGGLDGLAPGGAVRGTLRVPPSKSLVQRSLLAAALARGTTRIALAPGQTLEARDPAAALALLRACGICVEPRGTELAVVGRPPGVAGWAGAEASAGESATLARLALAVLALCAAPGERSRLSAEGTLAVRRSAPLVAALRAAGALVTGPPGAPWPLAIEACRSPVPSELVLEEPVSSQELSGLLLACAALPGARRVTVRGALPSRPYALLTARVLERFGARVAHEPLAGGERWSVAGPLTAPDAPLPVEPDASAAAVGLAAAALSGGEVLVPGLGARSLQADVAAVALLARFGIEARATPAGLAARGAPTRAAELDLAEHPDLAPVLAPVAAAAALAGGGASVLAGLGTLRRKESDRLTALAQALLACGFAADVVGESLRVGPAAAPQGARLDARGDHRLAFAFALLGLFVPGVLVAGAGCVAKSWPGFWEELARLGARRARG